METIKENLVKNQKLLAKKYQVDFANHKQDINYAIYQTVKHNELIIIEELLLLNNQLVDYLTNNNLAQFNIYQDQLNYYSALHLAVELDNLAALSILVTGGFDRSLRDKQGDTALSLAIEKNKQTAIELLMDNNTIALELINPYQQLIKPINNHSVQQLFDCQLTQPVLYKYSDNQQLVFQISIKEANNYDEIKQLAIKKSINLADGLKLPIEIISTKRKQYHTVTDGEGGYSDTIKYNIYYLDVVINIKSALHFSKKYDDIIEQLISQNNIKKLPSELKQYIISYLNKAEFLSIVKPSELVEFLLTINNKSLNNDLSSSSTKLSHLDRLKLARSDQQLSFNQL